MRQHEIKAIFDQQAAGYDQQWARMAPINSGLYFLLESIFVDLPGDAHDVATCLLVSQFIVDWQAHAGCLQG